MNTDDSLIAHAVEDLHQGNVIAYPTEAVYGLGCDPFNANAVSKLLQLKKRSLDKGFILVAANLEQIESLIDPIKPEQYIRVLASWPGPTTWVFPASSEVPRWVRGNHKTVALRVSAHPLIVNLCEKFAGPIISTSANLEGQPPIRDYLTVKMTFGNKLATILPGAVGARTKPTEIRDAITGEILRAG